MKKKSYGKYKVLYKKINLWKKKVKFQQKFKKCRPVVIAKCV